MKYSLYAAVTSLFLISCGNNDNIMDDPRPIDQEIRNFEFKSYAVKNTVLYKGAAGQKTTPDESYLTNYWSTYQEPTWKNIRLDLKNNSIQLISGTSADVSYTIKITNDSVLIKDNNNQPNYIGNFNKSTSMFTLKRTFRYIKRVPRNHGGLIIAQNTFFGTTQYENIFGIAFTSPLDMTETGDTVLWSNIEYYYKSL
ncbi:hypothetical protein EG347_08660 [Chryseobacterium sp. G0186]|uniref:hypothetical protein n=1 Tax=Chryseobacterium sp. G0186 TaxID=2487064 RepID=UPI000F4E2AF0|nr:hypothetical protein [Chryseobacterium sp. G0186]AZA77579.1 hypothetical protein EG347_08660 [Chryseobacterium sp. G0186]